MNRLKTLRNALLIGLIATLVFSLIPEPVSAASKSYKVQLTANLNIRAKANSSSKKLGTLKKGKIVTVQNHNSKWVKFTYQKKTAYLLKKHTKKYTAPKSYKAKITASSLTIRSKANTSSKKLGTYKKNKIVTVTPHNSKWVKVRYKNQTGYLLKQHTKKYTAPKPYKAQITANSLTIRSKANTSSKKLGTYKKNKIVTVTKHNSKWVKVQYKNKTGYLLTKHTKKYTAPKSYKAEVTASHLIIRAKANTSSAKLGTYKKGTVFTATPHNNNWLKLTYNKKTGYVAKTYTKEYKAPATKPAATPTTSTEKPVNSSTGTAVPFEKRYIGEITGTSVHVRETASTLAKSLGTISKPYTIVGSDFNSGWVKIYFERRIGYISKDYVKQITATDDGVTAYQLMDIRYPSKVTAAHINQYIAQYEKSSGRESVFRDTGQTFINIGNQAGINPVILVAMAIHESAYGTSGLSHAKYNIFSVAAFDTSPYDSAYKFLTVRQAIEYQVDFLKRGYLAEPNAPGSDYRSMGQFLGKGRESNSGSFINGTGSGMNYYYASDKDWGKRIAQHANKIYPFKANEFNNIGLMTGITFGTQIPNYDDDFRKMNITGVAKTAIPLYASKDKSKAAIATLPNKGKFQLLTKSNNHWMQIQYNGKNYYFQVSLSSYKSHFTLDNLLRYNHKIPEKNLRYAQQTTANIPSGTVGVYR